MRCCLPSLIVVEEEDDLFEVEQVLEVGPDGLLGGLGPQGDRDDRPVGAALPDGQGVKFALGDHDRLAASEEVLTEKGPREVPGDRVGLVLVLGLVSYESARLVVVGEDDALLGDIKADPELAASLSRETTAPEGLYLPR